MPRLQQTVIDEFATWTSGEGIDSSSELDPLWRGRITILLQGRADYLDDEDSAALLGNAIALVGLGPADSPARQRPMPWPGS